MKYSVVWARTAERQLAELWLSSSDRNAITMAALAIDRQLETEPLDVGESRDLDQRVLLSLPLGVIYRVRSDANSV